MRTSLTPPSLRHPSTQKPATRRVRMPSWPLRVATWLVVLSQILLPFSNQLFAVGADARHAPPEPTPQNATVNRTVPHVTPPSPSPSFSAEPTDEEISQARVFHSPVVSI